MKIIVTFKAEPEERTRWHAALAEEGKGRTLSEICRAALDRVADRVEREGQE